MRHTGKCGSSAILVTALATLVGCGSGSHRAASVSSGSVSSGSVSSGSVSSGSGLPSGSPATSNSGTANPPYLIRQIHTGSKPCATLGAAGSIWVADITDSTVKQLDPASGRILAGYPTAAGPCGMAYGGGALWVEDYSASAVTRIEPATRRVSTITVGNLPYDITFAAGAAWVTNYGDGTVTRIDARTHRTSTIGVGPQPIGIAASGGAIWVSDSGSQQLSRIDPVTAKVTTVPFGGTPSWTAFDRDTVWISDQSAGQVVRLDARNGRIVRRITVGATPNDGDVLDGAVWIPDKSGALYRLDERTDALTGPFRIPAGNPFVVAGYQHRLWIADYGGTGHPRGEPGAAAGLIPAAASQSTRCNNSRPPAVICAKAPPSTTDRGHRR